MDEVPRGRRCAMDAPEPVKRSAGHQSAVGDLGYRSEGCLRIMRMAIRSISGSRSRR